MAEVSGVDGESWAEASHGPLMSHVPAMRRVAERILGCRDLARDAVQEALVTFWLESPERGPDRAWLIRTVIHRSLHERRAQGRRRRWEGDAARETSFECPLCQPDLAFERRELASLLEEALRALPEAYRSVFVLREIEGLAYEGIARLLGIRVGTVRSRLNRARCALRVHLKAEVRPTPAVARAARSATLADDRATRWRST